MIDRDTVKSVRKHLEVALESVGKNLGMSIKVGSASFSSSNICFKIEVAAVENGQVMSREAEAWKQQARLFGLDPDGLGKQFTYGGRQYTITGLSPRRSRFPIMAEREDGKQFKFPIEVIKNK
jgi:hypothetical protein